MAQLDFDKIEKIDKRSSIHSKVATTYTTFEDGGKKYVQIDTYGNADRILPGKVSQSIQLDEESAKRLIKLLIDEFGLL